LVIFGINIFYVPQAKNYYVDTYDLKGGLFYSLFDTQINLDKEADYYHSVQNITGFAGVQSCSQLLIQFDPAYQKVHFHKLIIHRKGVKLDRTSELKFELLNNEGQLASSVYSGDLTAHAILTDIRRGDKVESSYTIYGDNPIFNGSYFRFLPLNDFIPIDKLNLDIFTEHPSKLKYKLDKASINDLTVTKEKKKLHLNYSKSNIEACEYEESMAYTELPMANLIVHSMDSWNEVQEWSQEVFKVDGNTTILEKLSPSLDESLSMKKQIDQAIKFVQDEIRYPIRCFG